MPKLESGSFLSIFRALKVVSKLELLTFKNVPVYYTLRHKVRATPLSSGHIFQPSSVQSAKKTMCFPSASYPLLRIPSWRNVNQIMVFSLPEKVKTSSLAPLLPLPCFFVRRLWLGGPRLDGGGQAQSPSKRLRLSQANEETTPKVTRAIPWLERCRSWLIPRLSL